MTGLRRRGTNTQWTMAQPLKKKCSSTISICSNMDSPRDYHSKQSKSDRERQILYDITYMWNLKNNTKESRYKT